LQCDDTDSLGLTDLQLTNSFTTMWLDVAMPVEFSVAVSCTASNCSALTNSQVNFQLELAVFDHETDQSTVLATIATNSDTEAYSGDGLQSDLTGRRADVTFTTELTLTSASCSDGAEHSFQLTVKDASGSEDTWTDNNMIRVPIPRVFCDSSAPSVDFSGNTFEVNNNNELPLNSPVYFT
ncbi:unnamed protein product, partial [Owenia fusiformis]